MLGNQLPVCSTSTVTIRPLTIYFGAKLPFATSCINPLPAPADYPCTASRRSVRLVGPLLPTLGITLISPSIIYYCVALSCIRCTVRAFHISEHESYFGCRPPTAPPSLHSLPSSPKAAWLAIRPIVRLTPSTDSICSSLPFLYCQHVELVS